MESVHPCNGTCCHVFINEYGDAECDCEVENYLKLFDQGSFTCHMSCDTEACPEGEFLYPSNGDKSIGQCTSCGDCDLSYNDDYPECPDDIGTDI